MNEDIKAALNCFTEAIAGMAWRIETEPETLDSSDYEKFDEWVLAMSKLPKEFWPDCMLND